MFVAVRVRGIPFAELYVLVICASEDRQLGIVVQVVEPNLRRLQQQIPAAVQHLGTCLVVLVAGEFFCQDHLV